MLKQLNINNMDSETLEEAARNDKKIEDYYIGKTLKIKKTIPSRYYETTLQESETIKIDKFVDGDVEGCRVAIGYKDDFEFLLFNTTHADSYLQGLYSLIDEPTITQEEPKQETLEEAAREYWKRGQFGLEKAADTERAFLRGGKWQAERSYSEEDLREAFKQSRQALIFEKDMSPVHNEFEDWFEQFKK